MYRHIESSFQSVLCIYRHVERCPCFLSGCIFIRLIYILATPHSSVRYKRPTCMYLIVLKLLYRQFIEVTSFHDWATEHGTAPTHLR